VREQPARRRQGGRWWREVWETLPDGLFAAKAEQSGWEASYVSQRAKADWPAEPHVGKAPRAWRGRAGPMQQRRADRHREERKASPSPGVLYAAKREQSGRAAWCRVLPAAEESPRERSEPLAAREYLPSAARAPSPREALRPAAVREWRSVSPRSEKCLPAARRDWQWASSRREARAREPKRQW
jgi:hypothetical protein